MNSSDYEKMPYHCKNIVTKHDKTWGYELWVCNSEKYCGKLLHFNAGKSLSFHYHRIKTETFYLHSGKLTVQLRDKQANDTFVELLPGDSLHIPPGQMHRITAIEDSDLFEFSTEHQEWDSYRIERSK